jgi:hypothetical protein
MLRLLSLEGLIEPYEHRPIGRMIRAGLRTELKTARHALRPRLRRGIDGQRRNLAPARAAPAGTEDEVFLHD